MKNLQATLQLAFMMIAVQFEEGTTVVNVSGVIDYILKNVKSNLVFGALAKVLRFSNVVIYRKGIEITDPVVLFENINKKINMSAVFNDKYKINFILDDATASNKTISINRTLEFSPNIVFNMDIYSDEIGWFSINHGSCKTVFKTTFGKIILKSLPMEEAKKLISEEIKAEVEAEAEYA